MPRASQALVSRYVEHTLDLIRVANAQSALTVRELRSLQRRIRMVVMENGLPRRNFKRQTELFAQLQAEIQSAYGRIARAQSRTTNELIELNADWAVATGRYSTSVTARTLNTVRNNMTVMGSSMQEHWEKQAGNLFFKVKAQIRMGTAAGQTEQEVLRRIMGDGADGRAGVMEQAVREARGTVDASTQAASDAGRRAAMRENGINALRWFAILDTSVCENCAVRADKLWTIDGEPLGHDIPYEAVPLHPWCRCILLPERYEDGPPEDGDAGINRFDKWLESLPPDRQDDLLGVGRAELWRQDKITTSDLIGQNGRFLTLGELRSRFPEPKK